MKKKNPRDCMDRVTSVDDLVGELDVLRRYGVSVSAAAYAHARQADIRLFALLERRDAALLVLRRASASPSPDRPYGTDTST